VHSLSPRPPLPRVRSTPVRCTHHDLACGPDGRCVLCRKQKLSGPPSAPPAPARRLGALVLGGLLLVAGGAAALIVTGPGRAAPSLPAIQLGVVSGGLSPLTAMPEPIAPRAPPAVPKDDPSLAWLQAVARGAPADPLSTATPDTAPLDTEPSAPAGSPLSWQEARQRVHVVVYTTGWCPHCKRAKAWMAASGVPYEERNIESSTTNADKNRSLNPRGSIPTFDVDGEVMVGFSEPDLVAMIERAAQRH
jgi:glutaredoxin 3